MSWGKFTVKGSEIIERKITSMMEEIRMEFETQIDKKYLKALILLGGYGRGEGGVLIKDTLEMPHNNFDFIFVTQNTDSSTHEIISKKVKECADRLSSLLDIGIDASTMSEKKLLHAPGRVIWYDMRLGHKTIAGDSSFVPSLTRFTYESIPPWDARNLMVNRGTLMVINDLLLQKKLDENMHKLIIKHIVKAIIGYGDALLFFLNDYNFSYVEKQKRMKKQDKVSPEFKKIYDNAVEFRFKPDYDSYFSYDINAWTKELKEHFQEIHLFCESARLRIKDLKWKGYTEHAFSHSLFEDFGKLKPMAKKMINYIKSSSYPKKSSFLSRQGYRTLGFQGILPVLFPMIAYCIEDAQYQELAVKSLGSSSDSIEDLRRAYLKKWGEFGDTNFINVLKSYNITL